MGWIELILLLICIGLLAIGVLACAVIYTSTTYPVIEKFDQEKTFLYPTKNERIPFPSLSDPPSLTLSVIIPAYNEEERLPLMLEDCCDYLTTRCRSQPTFGYEIILVDDGSRDSTTKVGLDFTRKLGPDVFRVLTLAKNRGKGGAVRLGALRARGQSILFADADGATKFEDFAKLETSLKEIETPESSHGIAIGSRAHLEEESISKRSAFRTVLMYGFHACVSFFGGTSGIKDTQCGFKLLTRNSARLTFNSLHIERWAFDVELLKIAAMRGVPITEVAVRWTEIDGSKLDPISAAIQMFKDLFLLWFRYKIGAWRIKETK